MKKDCYISLEDFCASQNIGVEFIISLADSGLIKIITVEGITCFHNKQLQQLEKFMRFYYELDINTEGIATVHHLLEKIVSMQSEILTLRNRLRLFE